MVLVRSSAAAGRAARPSSDVVIYLHGFASSGASGKAAYLRRTAPCTRGAIRGAGFEPADFSTLTITRMIDQVHALIAAEKEPVTLIGSSLGAYVAVNVAAKWPALVRSLILLAPALDLRDVGRGAAAGLARERPADGLSLRLRAAHSRPLRVVRGRAALRHRERRRPHVRPRRPGPPRRRRPSSDRGDLVPGPPERRAAHGR